MANVFGFSTEPAGDFMPILKYDARAGRLFRVDRENNGDGLSATNRSISRARSRRSSISRMSKSAGSISSPAARPISSWSRWARRCRRGRATGTRTACALFSSSPRPAAATSRSGKWRGRRKRSFRGIEAVFNAYLAGKGKNAGKLPVIVLEKTTPIKSGSGERQSTNYQPTFKIVSWAPRGDLVFEPKAGARATVAQQATAAGDRLDQGRSPFSGDTRNRRRRRFRLIQ